MSAQKNNTPLFSIITVCLNAPDLKATCESIVNQTFQDFEWIVIDGGSNSETLAIFDSYRHRIDQFISEKDNGIFDAMNKGIKLSSGNWINFMNAGDCYYDNNVLFDVKKFIKNINNQSIIYGNSVIRQNNNKLLYSNAPDSVSFKSLLTCCILHQAIFCNKDMFLKYGDYDINFKIISDWKFLLTLNSQGENFLKIDRIICKSAWQGASNNRRARIEEQRKMLSLFVHEDDVRHYLKKEDEKWFLNVSKLLRTRH